MLESDFDEVLGQDATQTQVFEAGQGQTALTASSHCLFPNPAQGFLGCSACFKHVWLTAGCVDSVLEGYNSSILA